MPAGSRWPPRGSLSAIATLSGGNQQKVLLARWAAREPELFLLNEPTRGIDVKTREAIHRWVESLAEPGRCVLLVSSDTQELIRLADRCLVFRSGRIIRAARTTGSRRARADRGDDGGDLNHQEHQGHQVQGEPMSWEPVDQSDDELARRIIGAAIEVHKILGPGFLESIYSKALDYEMKVSGLVVEREKEILVPYKDIQIPGQRLDLLVAGRVIVELKAVESLAPIHEAQLISYLKATQLRSVCYQFPCSTAQGRHPPYR